MDFTPWFVYASLLTCILMLLDRLGSAIVLREVISLFNSFIYLFMPLMGYLVFNDNFPIAVLFRRVMPVSQETYFNLALPAVSGFIVALCWPIRRSYEDGGENLSALISRIRRELEGNQKLGLYLMVAGVATSFFAGFMPIDIRYVFTLIYFSSFAGLLYIYFTKGFYLKSLYISGFVLLIVLGALSNGMFTILAYMGMTMFSFFFLKRKFAFWKKALFFSLTVVLLVLIQVVKPEYRKKVLAKDKDDKASEFAEIMRKRVSDQSKFFTPEFMWPIYYRANQGFYVALVQKNIPQIKPHDKGSKLMDVILSSFVPRLFWPDKPMAGGIENMRYYAGVRIRGYTMNVGPLGEAYGSFGVGGAIFFMVVLGAFIRWAYMYVFKLARKTPLLLLWIPFIFYQVTFSGENDTLQIMNTLVKSAFFIFLLSKLIPGIFKPNQALSDRVALSS